MTDNSDVRLLISDVNGEVFTDSEIDRFLALQSNNVFRGAALALDTIAANEIQVLKVVKILEITTDGAKTAEALRAQASRLRQMADDEEAREEGGAFDIADVIPNDFAYRNFMLADALRSQ